MVEIRFARHGHTLKAARDEDRELSEKGKEQAAMLGKAWAAEGFQPDLVLASAAMRAVETALIATDIAPEACAELYFGADPAWRKPIDEASAKLGYAPLAAYLASEGERAIRAYAKAAVAHILDLVYQRPNTSKVAVFGHAVLLQAIVVELLQRNPAANLEAILQLHLGECEVITLHI